MSRWSDRQFSEGTGSGWFGARTGERNFPPNIRVIGDSTKLAYPLCPGRLSIPNSVQIDGMIHAPQSLDFPPQAGLTETSSSSASRVHERVGVETWHHQLDERRGWRNGWRGVRSGDGWAAWSGGGLQERSERAWAAWPGRVCTATCSCQTLQYSS